MSWIGNGKGKDEHERAGLAMRKGFTMLMKHA